MSLKSQFHLIQYEWSVFSKALPMSVLGIGKCQFRSLKIIIKPMINIAIYIGYLNKMLLCK